MIGGSKAALPNKPLKQCSTKHNNAKSATTSTTATNTAIKAPKNSEECMPQITNNLSLGSDILSQGTSTSIKTENETLELSELTRKERLMQIAPKVSFDTDLEFWGKEVKPVPSIKLDSLHRFWKTSEHVEEFVPPDVVEAMRTRTMLYPVKYEPVKRACRYLKAYFNILP